MCCQEIKINQIQFGCIILSRSLYFLRFFSSLVSQRIFLYFNLHEFTSFLNRLTQSFEFLTYNFFPGLLLLLLMLLLLFLSYYLYFFFHNLTFETPSPYAILLVPCLVIFVCFTVFICVRLLSALILYTHHRFKEHTGEEKKMYQIQKKMYHHTLDHMVTRGNKIGIHIFPPIFENK